MAQNRPSSKTKSAKPKSSGKANSDKAFLSKTSSSVESAKPHDMSVLEQLVDKYFESIIRRIGVLSFGIGQKTVDGKRTGDLCLVVEVKEKKDVKDPIPAKIEGVPTDVVSEYERPTEDMEETSKSLPRIDHFTVFDPLMGGLPIKNPKLEDNAGVLGAIVFDCNTGDPMGLSVHHVIGNTEGKRKAEIGDPINHSLFPKTTTKIGELYKTDQEYDAALFKLPKSRNARKYTTKVIGNQNHAKYQQQGVEEQFIGPTEDIEIGEPIKPYVGMKVECLARRTYATGEIDYILWRSRKSGFGRLCKIKILFDKKNRTFAGDSGSIWLDRETKRPVGLHTTYYPLYFSMRKKKLGSAAMASSVYHLAEHWSFQFTEPEPSQLEQATRGYEVCFVNHGPDLIALCNQPGTAEPAVVKKFNAQQKLVSTVTSDVLPLSGLAAATLVTKSENANLTYVFWRSGDNFKLNSSTLNAAGTKLSDVDPAHQLPGFQTNDKPVAVSFKNEIVLAYTDVTSNRLVIVRSTNGTKWDWFATHQRSHVAPALAVFQGDLYLCWADKATNRLKFGKLFRQDKSYDVSTFGPPLPLQGHSTLQDPALCASDTKLYLAYSAMPFKGQGNRVRVLESSNGWQWTSHRCIMTDNQALPSLVLHNKGLIVSTVEV